MSYTWLLLSRILAAIPIGLSLWNASLAYAQAAAPAFEVTSVKPLLSRPAGFQGAFPACKGGHFEAIAPGIIAIQWAYNLDALQSAELDAKLPAWMKTAKGSYELEATTRPDVTEKECREMTQKLFEDRFHFKYHWETATGKVYEMVVARGGFKMEPANPDDMSSNFNVTINGRKAKLQPEAPQWRGLTMDELAIWISAKIGASPDFTPVVDKTGIQGRFKLKLAYSDGVGLDAAFADPDFVSAVEQQFGLKLQQARGPVQHFVVDSIEKPGAN